jgi:hypothetical protein
VKIDTAIEVVDAYRAPGEPRRQEPGLRHWVREYPGNANWYDAHAACGAPLAGMIDSRCELIRLTCEECKALFVVDRLKNDGSCWGCDGAGYTRVLVRDNNVDEKECEICGGTGIPKWVGIVG